jgi:K+-transporting ATPase KdpF subunit
MKTKIVTSFMIIAVAPAHSDTAISNSSLSYLIGGIVALLIMGYLIFTLIRPEKF